MRDVILYTAISLDGYIAKEDGGVDWLEQLPNPENLDYDYNEFYATVDTTLIGNKTYKQILGFGGDFPYPDKKSYVFSRKERNSTKHVEYVSENIPEFVRDLKKKPGKDIWLVGGGQINSILLEKDLIDKLIIFLFPVVLGTGISLFRDNAYQALFDLKSTKTYSTGVVRLLYIRKNHI